MTNFGQVKFAFLLLSLFLVAVANSQDAVEQNNKKNISLYDPSIDATVKSALENGSVSEVVVRKDLLLFPVNAPNLVIAHTQEIHAVPQLNGDNATDGKPTTAEVAEVNEYSLSQLVSTNDTDYDNETKSESSPVAATTLLRGPQNVSVLEPGKLLEIVSGFNLSNGMATEEVALPDEVQNISIPKQSISSLLSKSLQPPSDATMTDATSAAYDLYAPQPDATITTATPLYPYDIAKRSDDNDGTQESISSGASAQLPPYPYAVRKRSIDSDENDSSGESSGEDSASDELVSLSNNTSINTDSNKTSDDSKIDGNSSSVTEEDTITTSAENVKRSVNGDEDTMDSTGLSTPEYESMSTSSTIPDSAVSNNAKMVKRSVDLGKQHADSHLHNNYKVDNSFERLNVDGLTSNNSTPNSLSFPINQEPFNRLHNVEENLKEGSPEDMDVAEDIVFRPLFRYRQETRLRQESSAYRKSGYRKSAYNTFNSAYDDQDDRYKTDNDNDYE